MRITNEEDKNKIKESKSFKLNQLYVTLSERTYQKKSDWYKKSLNERVILRGKAKSKNNKKKKKIKHIITQKTLINCLIIIIF